MNTNTIQKTVKPEAEIKQKQKDQKRKTNHREIVNFIIKNYESFSTEDIK